MPLLLLELQRNGLYENIESKFQVSSLVSWTMMITVWWCWWWWLKPCDYAVNDHNYHDEYDDDWGHGY